jgi:sugar transferase (PEP-CTERM/EpsH1 system associated)
MPKMSRPLKVMHLHLRFYFAGAETGVLKLVNGFDRMRVLPSVCTGLSPDSIVDLMRTDVKLHHVPRRESGNDPVWIARLVAFLTRERPDILHTHNWPTLFEGVLAGRLAGVPLIVHGEHGTIETRPRNLWIQRQVWSRVDGVLSVSSRLRDRLAQTVGVPAERITTIRNGVDTDRFRPSDRGSARALLGLPANAFVAGTVGRLHPVKDQHSLISAIGLVRKAGIPITGLLVGDGSLRDELEQHAAREHVRDDIVFLGARADVETVLASLDVFTLSSVSEGLSNVILEAMAAGRAVVATDVGGTDELVVDGSTGILVPPSNPTRLAEALRRLATDSSCRDRMGAAARQRAEQEFSLSRMVRRYEDYYEDLASSRRIH